MTSFRPPPLRLDLDSISEIPEYSTPLTARMDLGTESPESITRPSVTPTSPACSALDGWGNVGVAVNAHVPARRRSWRSLSFVAGKRQGFKRFQKEKVDTDCAICFDPAFNPRKTTCCGQIFCYTHLADWLRSNKNCPSCDSVCPPVFSPLSASAPLSNLASSIENRKPTTPIPTPSSSYENGPDQHALGSLELLNPEYQVTPAAEMFPFLAKLWPISLVVSEEIGKLLIWIAFILILCIIYPPT